MCCMNFISCNSINNVKNSPQPIDYDDSKVGIEYGLDKEHTSELKAKAYSRSGYLSEGDFKIN